MEAGPERQAPHTCSRAAPLSAVVGDVLTRGFLGLHSAVYATSKDSLPRDDQPLGQHPMVTAGLGLSGMCLSLSAFQSSDT